MVLHQQPTAFSDDYEQIELEFDATYDGLCDERPAPAGGPAHDIANLLSVIVAVCESLSEDPRAEPRNAELARAGLLAAERAAGLLDEMRERSGGPRRPDVEAQRRPVPSQTQAPVTAAPTVLVVDDDPRLLTLMSAAFTRAGFRTFSARNGRVGLQILRAAKPDLLVTDIVMPEMEGLATIRAAKDALPSTRVVAISGGGEYQRVDTFLTWAEGLGADEVLAKPFKMSSLLTAARLVLSREQGPDITARAI